MPWLFFSTADSKIILVLKRVLNLRSFALILIQTILVPKGGKMLLSLGQILMNTIFAPNIFEFFLADNFIFDAKERIRFWF